MPKPITLWEDSQGRRHETLEEATVSDYRIDILESIDGCTSDEVLLHIATSPDFRKRLRQYMDHFEGPTWRSGYHVKK